MNITDTIAQMGGADWVRKNASGTTGKVVPTVKGATTDSVSISGDARKMSSTGATQVRARVEALPEVREEKIQEARNRVEAGYYQNPEFDQVLAEKLIQTQYGA